jgi:bifunctional non-homologous end joining protein LigD
MTLAPVVAFMMFAFLRTPAAIMPALAAFPRPVPAAIEKVDGWRMLAYKDGGAVKLVSRQGRDHTRRFPAIVAAIRAMAAPTLVLDGEVAVFDRALISRFEWLRHSAPPDLATPPIFMAFDCLYHRGQDLRPRPLATRRNVLEDVLDGQDLVLPARRLSDGWP